MEAWAPFQEDYAIEDPRDSYALRLEEITEKHQRIEVHGTWEDQTAQGRPPALWSPCLNSRCDSYSCLPSPYHNFGLRYRNRIKNGGNGPDLLWRTIDGLADIVWPGAATAADRMTRHMILGSFFHSPLVMNAYIQFKMDVRLARIKTTRSGMDIAIRQVTPFVERVIAMPDTPEAHQVIRWYLGSEFQDHKKQRTLADAVTKFMLSCEVWRSYPSARSKGWAFGSPRVVCDVLGGILLGIRAMDQLRIVARTILLGDQARNEAWARWIQQYPLCAVQDNPYTGDGFIIRSAARPDTVPGRAEAAVLAEVGYLGAVGTYSPDVKRKLTRRNADESISTI